MRRVLAAIAATGLATPALAQTSISYIDLEEVADADPEVLQAREVFQRTLLLDQEHKEKIRRAQAQAWRTLSLTALSTDPSQVNSALMSVLRSHRDTLLPSTEPSHRRALVALAEAHKHAEEDIRNAYEAGLSNDRRTFFKSSDAVPGAANRDAQRTLIELAAEERRRRQ